METLNGPLPRLLWGIVFEYVASNILLFLLFLAAGPETVPFRGYEKGQEAHFFQELLPGYGSFHVQ